MNAKAVIVMRGVAVLAWMLASVEVRAQDGKVLLTQGDKDSYAIGADLARNLKRQGVEVEIEALLRGMRDGLTGEKPLMTDEEVRKRIRAYDLELKKKQMRLARVPAVLAQDNLEKGAAFLAENKTKEGVVTLPSGLQYKVMKAGHGKKPVPTDTVECAFRGTFIDGRQFTGSDCAGKVVPFKVSEVIPGWKEALQQMSTGSKWQLFLPPHLAYGERGLSGSKIGPNSTLIYELELVSVQ